MVSSFICLIFVDVIVQWREFQQSRMDENLGAKQGIIQSPL